MPRTAKLFMNGRSQAVRLPAEFRFPGREVHIRKDEATGDIVLSSPNQNWDELFRLIDELTPEERATFEMTRDPTPPKPRNLF